MTPRALFFSAPQKRYAEQGDILGGSSVQLGYCEQLRIERIGDLIVALAVGVNSVVEKVGSRIESEVQVRAADYRATRHTACPNLVAVGREEEYGRKIRHQWRRHEDHFVYFTGEKDSNELINCRSIGIRQDGQAFGLEKTDRVICAQQNGCDGYGQVRADELLHEPERCNGRARQIRVGAEAARRRRGPVDGG